DRPRRGSGGGRPATPRRGARVARPALRRWALGPADDRACGGDDPIGHPGEKSRTVGWDELAAARPQVAVVMPCGYDATRAAEEARAYVSRLAELGAESVVAVDAAAYFSRPGPRLVDGVELLGHLLHPTRVTPPPGARAIAVEPSLNPTAG